MLPSLWHAWPVAFAVRGPMRRLRVHHQRGRADRDNAAQRRPHQQPAAAGARGAVQRLHRSARCGGVGVVGEQREAIEELPGRYDFDPID